MLYQPTNMIPSSFSGEGNDVISAAEENTFSATLWGMGFVTAYQICIYENTAESAKVYDSGVVQLDAPFEPRNYDGSENRFEAAVPAGAGMTNEFKDGYKWTLTLWETYSADNPAGTRITSPENFFWAKETPSLTIEAASAPAVITARENTWRANYSGASPILWFQWTLAEAIDGRYEVIHQTGRIYQTPRVWFRYDGLVSGKTYAARVLVVNQHGVATDSGWAVSEVHYAAVSVASATKIRQDGSAVVVDWGGVQYIVGKARHTADDSPSDDYAVTQDAPAAGAATLRIEDGTYVAFEPSATFPVDIPEGGTIVWSGTPALYDAEKAALLSWTPDDGAGAARTLCHAGFVPGLSPAAALTPSGTLAPDGGMKGRFVYRVGGTEYSAPADNGPHGRYAALLRGDGFLVSPIES